MKRYNIRMIAIFAIVLLSTSAFAVKVLNSSSAFLGQASTIKCGSGITCAVAGAQVTITDTNTSGPITLESEEVINNTVDDTIEFLSNDEVTTVQILGFEGKNAVLNLYADQGDDNADKFSITSNTTNNLVFANNGTGFWTFSSAGVVTMADSETLTNASDVVTLAADDAAADLTLKGFEASNAQLVLQADESDDNGDDWRIQAAASGNALTFANDTSGSQVAKLTLSTAGAMSSVVSITGTGAGALYGYLQNNVASTTATLTAGECGSTIVSNSADVMTLPEASTVLGCRYTFVCGTADDLDVNPADGTDQIGPALNSVAGGTGSAITPSAGDAIRCTDIGSSITIQAVGNDLWAPIGVGNGAWTDVN